MRGLRMLGLLALTVAATPKAEAQQYAFSLIDVPGAVGTTAYGINNHGDISGTYNPGVPGSRSFLLSGGVFTEITVPDAVSVGAWKINDQQQIVGRWDDASARVRGFVWTAGAVTVVDVPDSTFTVARGINNAGDLVGTYRDSNSIQRGFLLRSGVFTTIDYPGSTATWATAINVSGDIVGQYRDAQGVDHGYLLRAGQFSSIDYPGATRTIAHDINAQGRIVGEYTAADGKTRGFDLDGANYASFEAPGSGGTSAIGINDAGTMVGRADSHGFNAVPFTAKYVVVNEDPDRLHVYDENSVERTQLTRDWDDNLASGLCVRTDASKHWVLNSDRRVFVYDGNLQHLHSWYAWSLPNSASPEGIATYGADVWIVDSKSDKVYKYDGAVNYFPGYGNVLSSSNFRLKNTNTNPKDIVTNGTHFFVVDDAATDKVYKYTMAGVFVSSFTLATPGATKPAAISIDPAYPNALWVVDGGTKRIYVYDFAVNAANNSNQSAASSFPLAAGNTNPQGLAIKP